MNSTVKKLFTLCLVFSIAGTVPVLAKREKDKKSKRHRRCKKKAIPPVLPPGIIGTWLLNTTATSSTESIDTYEVFSANTDGIVSSQSSLAIEQQFLPDFPIGALSTVSKGIWQQRGSTVFQVISTGVINLQGTTLQENAPFARTVTEYTKLEISKDRNSLTLSGSVSFFEPDNITLTKPLLDQNGVPIFYTITAVGSRLDFITVGAGP